MRWLPVPSAWALQAWSCSLANARDYMKTMLDIASGRPGALQNSPFAVECARQMPLTSCVTLKASSA